MIATPKITYRKPAPKLTAWGWNGPAHPDKCPRLTPIERRTVMNIDKIGAMNAEETRAMKSRQRTESKMRGMGMLFIDVMRAKRAEARGLEYTYTPGAPIAIVADCGPAKACALRKAHAAGVSLDTLSVKYDLRVEWLREIIEADPREKKYFRW